MSLLGKIAGGIAKILPVAGLIAPSSKRVTQALGTLSKVGNVLQGGIGQAVMAGGITALAMGGGGGGGAPTMPMSLPALPPPSGGGRALATIAAATPAGRLARIGRGVAKAAGYVVAGSLVYDAAGNLVGTTGSRQINPLNHRAARRAVRRIKAVRKLCHSIERALPKQKSRSCKR